MLNRLLSDSALHRHRCTVPVLHMPELGTINAKILIVSLVDDVAFSGVDASDEVQAALISLPTAAIILVGNRIHVQTTWRAETWDGNMYKAEDVFEQNWLHDVYQEHGFPKGNLRLAATSTLTAPVEPDNMPGPPLAEEELDQEELDQEELDQEEYHDAVSGGDEILEELDIVEVAMEQDPTDEPGPDITTEEPHAEIHYDLDPRGRATPVIDEPEVVEVITINDTDEEEDDMQPENAEIPDPRQFVHEQDPDDAAWCRAFQWHINGQIYWAAYGVRPADPDSL
jgi:hypothetical protein